MTVRDTLELDIAEALAAVNNVGASLDQMVTSVKVGLADAVSALNNIPNIAIEVDTSAITAAVEEAVGEADATVTVDGDASSISETIEEEAENTEPIVTITADTTQAEGEVDEFIAVVSAESVTIGVDANAAQAKNDIDEATKSTEGLSKANAGLEAASALSAGSVVGLGSAVGFQNAQAGIATATVGLLGGVLGSFFNDATAAAGATEAFNRQVGVFAEDVQNVNVAGLNEDLSTLAERLGSDDEALLTVNQKLFALAQSAGVAGPEAASLANTFTALGANAVAANPELGDVASVTDRLTNALARGGRALTPFGISLTAVEIEARALQNTGKDTTRELTQFEKATAGAQLALESLGPSIAANIEAGAANSAVQVRSLREEFSNAIEDIGAPIVSPVIELLRSANPLFIGVAEIFGTIGQAVIPLFNGIFTAAQPAFVAIVNIVDKAIVPLVPALTILGEAFANTFEPVAPVINALVPVIEVFALGLGGVIEVVAAIISGLGPLPAILGLAYLAWQAFSAALLANPVLLAVAAIIALVGAFRKYNEQAEETTTNSEQFRSSMFDTAATVDETKKKMDELIESSDEYILRQSLIGKNQELVSGLNSAGISLQKVREELSRGSRGVEDLVSGLVQAGQVRIEVDGVTQSAEQIRAMNGQLSGLLATEQAVVVEGESMVVAINNETFAREQAARAQLDQLVALGQLSPQVRQQAVDQTNAANGTASYAQALDLALQKQTELNAQAPTTVASLQGNAAAYTALTQSIALGVIPTEQQLQGIADKLGISLEQARTFADAANAAITVFVDSAVQKLPSVDSLFQSLTDKSSPVELTKNLQESTIQILTFGTNLETIRTQGFAGVAEFLTKQGPEAAGAFASAFTNMTAEQKVALEQSIEANNAARKSYGDQLRTDIANSKEASAEFAKNATAGFNEELKFAEVTTGAIDEARVALTDEGVVGPVKKEASATGSDIGNQLAAGIESGLISGMPSIEFQAREAVRRAKEAMENEAEIKSPSRVFAVVGALMGEGAAIGLRDAGAQVVAEAEAIVRGAAGAIGAGDLQLALTPTAGAATAAAGGAVTQQFSIEVAVTAAPGVTPAQAQEHGQAVGRGILDVIDVEARIS